eukprot:TRINITY_DN3141_c0_g2_i2.p1 TRINITY_DN3141_c0_g2~~TRINITY_DN3141_c0_g2_i2.p1  ORF type:complete len:438 (+),score=151.46 TRINITY_DN3141_c0_g2_i2:276-1589(+)
MGIDRERKMFWGGMVFILAFLVLFNVGHVEGHAGHVHPPNRDDTDNSTSTDHHLTSSQIGIGFGLSFLAAGFSSFGSLIPVVDKFVLPLIFPGFALLGSKLFFAGTLSFAGGLLLALSLWDLSPEAVESLGNSGWFDTKHAGLVVVACVVCGMLFIALTSWIAGKLAPKNVKTCACDTTVSDALAMNSPSKPKESEKDEIDLPPSPAYSPSACCIDVEDESIKQNPKEEEMEEIKQCNLSASRSSHGSQSQLITLSRKNSSASQKPRKDGGEASSMLSKEEEEVNIYKFGLQLSVAIAIHNIPEGLAMFVSVVQSPTVGFLFGLALCIHKIPEGLIISVPLYHATGSRLKAFLATLFIGMISTPLGAAIGYGVYSKSFNNGVNGIVLSIVAGAMIYIALKGMLPMARLYDPRDRCVTVCTLVGVIVLMISTALFTEV